MRDESLRFQAWLSVGLILVGLLIGIAHHTSQPLTWDYVERHGKLVVLTRNAATTWFEDREGRPEGFEYRLAKAFADHLGVEAEFVVVNSTSELFRGLDYGRGHIAAAGLMPTAAHAARYDLTPAYARVRQQLVCNRYGERPGKLEELPGHSIAVPAGSAYEARLRELRGQFPELTWTAEKDADTEELLGRVAEKKVDCTVAHANIVTLNRYYHPELVVPFNLSEAQPLMWALPPEADKLKRALEAWFSRRDTAQLVKELADRFYGQVEKFDYVDLARFRRRIDSRLPRYKAKFKSVARRHGLPWTLLAAVSYQESHWDPDAESATGVRGLMMLTLNTAEHLGVKDREDPAQAIAGGAKYLADLMERIPESVTGRDRLWFALAAYNVGMGHIYDARRLARKLGRDPDNWITFSKVLPLLSRQKYYTMKGIKHGYARGGEPVRYVKRVRQYMDILDREFGS
ncbi:MAG: membrane-bound lytic murein transglycosylase MltF [Alphaproteobacteria bacterium]